MGLIPDIYENLCDPGLHTAAEAIAAAKECARADPVFCQRLARTLLDGTHGLPFEKAFRLMEILEEVSKPLQLSLIVPLLNHPDARVQSKASVLVVKGNADIKWIRKRLRHADSRVRANLLEALWAADPNVSRPVFVEALQDGDNRVMGNALLGLYRLNEAGCVEKIIDMARHPKDEFRTTAVWVMEKTGDARFVPVLSQLLREGGKNLQPKVLRALTRVKIANAKPPAATGMASASERRSES
jgi:hypothetical protein